MARKRPKAAAPATSPPPLLPATTKRFEQDVARMQKRGANMDQLKAAIETLCARAPLPERFWDHPLKGEWKDHRDCHVAPDWLLVYQKTEMELILVRTGTHADLFGK